MPTTLELHCPESASWLVAHSHRHNQFVWNALLDVSSTVGQVFVFNLIYSLAEFSFAQLGFMPTTLELHCPESASET